MDEDGWPESRDREKEKRELHLVKSEYWDSVYVSLHVAVDPLRLAFSTEGAYRLER